MPTIIVEVRAAEGGEDAKLLVREQVALYLKYIDRKGLEATLLTDLPGMMTLRITGRGAVEAFAHEAGGHRWQRVPPTERKGRRHTSTITVAVLSEPTETQVHVNPGDLRWKACRGSGAGGQHRNVTDSAIQLTHIPSGTTVRVESERSQHQNKRMALGFLRAKLLERESHKAQGRRSRKRKGQVGSGMRGDKVRSVSVFRDQVVDHRTGQRIPFKKYARGFVEDLWV
jgi:peptide chain release factor 1